MALNNMFDVSNKFFVHKGFVSKPMLYVLQIAGVGVLLSGCFVGYRAYSLHRAQAAQRRFSDEMVHYINAAQEKPGSHNWNMVAGIFEEGANEYANTSLAPFFVAYQAQALLKDNKLAEASKAMDRAVSLMSQANPFYYTYALKSVLMGLDVAEAENRSTDELEKKLVELANNKENQQRDEALYYLGRYYLYKNNLSQARTVLEELISLENTSKDPRAVSPWANQAELLIKQIAA